MNNSKKDLMKLLNQARADKYAVGAFNIFNYVSAHAAINAAEQLNTPIILQTSTSTVKKFGVEQLIKMLRLLTDNSSAQVVIHLDHCTSVELAKQCIDNGWDSVMIEKKQGKFNLLPPSCLLRKT